MGRKVTDDSGQVHGYECLKPSKDKEKVLKKYAESDETKAGYVCWMDIEKTLEESCPACYRPSKCKDFCKRTICPRYVTKQGYPVIPTANATASKKAEQKMKLLKVQQLLCYYDYIEETRVGLLGLKTKYIQPKESEE